MFILLSAFFFPHEDRWQKKFSNDQLIYEIYYKTAMLVIIRTSLIKWWIKFQYTTMENLIATGNEHKNTHSEGESTSVLKTEKTFFFSIFAIWKQKLKLNKIRQLYFIFLSALKDC